MDCIGGSRARRLMVALPFVRTEECVAPAEAKEMPNKGAAVRRAKAMSRMRHAPRAGVQAERRSEYWKFRRRGDFENLWRSAGEFGRAMTA
jgi:hypothetical protein